MTELALEPPREADRVSDPVMNANERGGFAIVAPCEWRGAALEKDTSGELIIIARSTLGELGTSGDCDADTTPPYKNGDARGALSMPVPKTSASAGGPRDGDKPLGTPSGIERCVDCGHCDAMCGELDTLDITCAGVKSGVGTRVPSE